jgi:hypothetical protein
MDQFIQASRGENVFNGLSDNEQNLNMSSISRMDESTPSRNNVVSDDDRDGNSDRKISRQPTFSSFTPQPRYDEYSNYQVQNSDNQDQKSEERSNRNLYLSDAGMKPLLSSISGSNDNSEKLSKFIQYSNNHQTPNPKPQTPKPQCYKIEYELPGESRLEPQLQSKNTKAKKKINNDYSTSSNPPDYAVLEFHLAIAQISMTQFIPIVPVSIHLAQGYIMLYSIFKKKETYSG